MEKQEQNEEEKDQPMQGLALLVAVNCVRNTIIEQFHADGKLSDADMKLFNSEVADKLYTFFTYFLGRGSAGREAVMRVFGLQYPLDWNSPELVASMVKVFEEYMKKENHL